MAVTVRGTILTVLLCSCVLLVGCSLPGVVDNEDGTGTITMTANVGEEDAHSPFLPDSLRCDACRIIAHMLYIRFDKQHNKMKSLIEKVGRLRESDVMDIIDSVCEDSFESIGVKEVNGRKRLSGPGLETKDIPGVMQGGGKWPYRLRSMCGTYTGDVGEEEIYSAYLEHRENLVDFLCRGTGVRADCVKENQKSNESKSEEKEEL
ncbi:marginal zone B- and B1-cell-specific protein-like [Gigantopelta aegis]|uniref:marginal zone B- and B1-cell-specific protein-like n=1 Tax=Gigantopelta aegis TaxID=1735272 RepID=UPI001B88DCCC|nr:marginal zone B- and B1-cell-specific protein-like [Gigantopelta aegis]